MIGWWKIPPPYFNKRKKGMKKMNRIQVLPKWIFPDTIPSVYDTTSGSHVEMCAKVYGAMRNLQIDYEKFVSELNQTIEDFKSGQIKEHDCFINRMTKVIHDYLDYLDAKVRTQDKEIAEAVKYMKDNIGQSVTEIIGQMHESGEFDEAVLNAIENFGSRVINLETKMLNQETKANDFENRIISLETNKVQTIYNADMEELNFINVTGGAN